MAKGYGALVENAREAAGLSRKQLAARIDRTESTVRRIEQETSEPSSDQINALVAALPISAEDLLRAMGINLNVPAASRLPRDLVQTLLALTPRRLANVEEAARGQLLLQSMEEPPSPPQPRKGPGGAS